MLTLEEAQARLLARASRVASERVELTEAGGLDAGGPPIDSPVGATPVALSARCGLAPRARSATVSTTGSSPRLTAAYASANNASSALLPASYASNGRCIPMGPRRTTSSGRGQRRSRPRSDRRPGARDVWSTWKATWSPTTT